MSLEDSMLQVNNLICGYDGSFELKQIDFELQARGILGIIGPNGSGKTTLLRAIARVLKPKAGTITLEGKDIWQIDLEQFARRVAVVSQNLPSGSLSVEEFVLLGRIPHLARLQFWESKQDLKIAHQAMSLTDIFILNLYVKTAVKRQTFLGDIKLSHNFNTG